MTKVKIYTFSGIIIAILIGLGYYSYNRYFVNRATVVAPTTSTSTISVDGIEYDGGGPDRPKVEVVKIPLPDLDRPISADKLPEKIRSATLSEIRGLTSALKSNSKDYSSWINLGLQYKELEDYEGARLAWEYAAALSPSQSLAFINLGTLYAYYLHDNALAEENYREAIRVEPKLGYTYDQLYEFYRFILKNDTKAKAILQQGIKADATEKEKMQYTLDHFNTLQ